MSEFFVFFGFFSTVLNFLPIFLYTDVYLDVRENKCWFSLSLYKHFKIYGGYAQLASDGIALHLTKKKAVFVPYDNMTDTRKKFEITKGFQLWRFHQIVETGGAERVYGVFLATLLQSASAAIFSVLQTKHPFLSLKNSTLLTEDPTLKVTFESALIFNVLILTIALNKKLLEAFLNWIRTKKSTASWKKQQSN